MGAHASLVLTRHGEHMQRGLSGALPPSHALGQPISEALRSTRAPKDLIFVWAPRASIATQLLQKRNSALIIKGLSLSHE